MDENYGTRFKINSVEVEESERGVDTIEDYNYLVNKYLVN